VCPAIIWLLVGWKVPAAAIINEEFEVCDLCLTHIFRMLAVFADRDLSVC
jgi:hypothetical protein